MDPDRPSGRGPILAGVLLAIGLLTSTSIAVWQYVELRRAEARIEELESEGSGGGGGIFGDLEETFREAFEEGLGSLGEGVGGLAACLLPDEPISSEPISDLPVEQQIAAIAETVERLRGLEFREPVEPTFLSPEGISARVRELFLEEYTPALGAQEERILSALGAIPPGTDLRALRADLLGSQVAGFYDPQTGELVVRRAGDELTSSDRVVLAHELDHVLTDQALGLPLPDDLRAGSEDGDLAATALVEGDATLLMQQYSASLSFEDQLGALDPTALVDALQAQTDLAELPHYLQAELRFPYESGLTYVCDRFERGGWAEIDAAYTEPPGSSLEILAPGREAAGTDDVDVPGRLGRPWKRSPERQLGAASLLWLFEAPGGETVDGLENAREAVGEWRGGTIELWTRGSDSAIGVTIADRPGGISLCAAVADWYRRSFDDDEHPHDRSYDLVAYGPTQNALVTCEDDEVRLGIAPDPGTAADLIT